MNVLARLFQNAQSAPWWRGAGACLGLSILGGCAGASPFATAPVDPESPAAQAVLEGARAETAYPKFSDIPPTPANPRPARSWAQAVAGVEAAGAELAAQTAPGTWTLDGTTAFAARAQAAATPPPAITTSDTEAFARDARARATPPPSPR
ncbi:hypothetical protein [Phenylobacterium sp.]|uniref:hypothetical protein n=1 Tax=Phenylobacterium sp. TaxID=1871053 RepID=UPI0027308DD2|nr:hypothetical protein [Phenylobacterium sp.]MDP1618388.1 hypothetical protein [Phenylobacterium sp.]MDP1986488.1 hypothetical protein [Phenylobacterium sp.]